MKAEYIDHMGDDNRVVDAARVSFSKIAENYTEDQNARLIKYLANHNHFTPFTHPMITLREAVPIFVARQRFKHVVGFTYNEVSRRYVDDDPEFYHPDMWRTRPEGSMKQGSGKDLDRDEVDIVNEHYREALIACENAYDTMLELGVAPEQARMVLPQSMYTSYYVTGSLAAWARAYKLRIKEDAQYEIRVLAKQWDDVIRPLYPLSWSSLVD